MAYPGMECVLEYAMRMSTRIGILGAILPWLLHGQSTQSGQKPRFYPVHSVVSPVRQVVTALGDRVQKPGNERVIMTGTLSRSGVSSTAQIILEMPGLLRIDETGGKGKSLVYDLGSLMGASAVVDDDEGLAESLQNDTAETFLTRPIIMHFGAGKFTRFRGQFHFTKLALAGLATRRSVGVGEVVGQPVREKDLTHRAERKAIQATVRVRSINSRALVHDAARGVAGARAR
jgi:hypothetical protein